MAEIKADPPHSLQHRLIVTDPDISVSKSVTTRRLSSLDIFRGLTVVLMILVDDAGGEWPKMGHAPWNGCNLADFVMPFFLFIVGMAIALALKRIPSKAIALRKVIFRTLKLLLWGVLLQGGFSHAPDELTYGVDMKMIRWCGILQRIALAYFIVALVEIFSRKTQPEDLAPSHFSIFKSYAWHWLVGACVLIIYLAVLYGTYVPDWHFEVHQKDAADYGKIFSVACGVRGKLDPPCNAVGYIDRKILGLNHMYHHPAWRRSKACTENSPYEGPLRNDAPSWCHAPFEPEGILSSIASILSTIIGVHFGHIIIHFKDHSTRLKHWILMGSCLLVLGISLHFTHAIPLNKQLYTFSYVCVTSGAASLVFSAFYTLSVGFIQCVVLWAIFVKSNMTPKFDQCNADGKVTCSDLDSGQGSSGSTGLVDIWGLRYGFLLFEWIGKNAMLVYVMAAEGIFAGFINGWYYNDPHNTLIYWVKKHIFIGVWHSRRVGVLLYVIFAEILFWGLICGVFHWMGIYWKL